MATATPRKKKDGSISYTLRASKGCDYSGKQLRPTKTWTPPPGMPPATIRKELERQKMLFDDEVSNMVRMDSNRLSLGDFLANWMQEYAEGQLSPATLALYRQYIPVITAKIGHIMLSALTARDLQRFYQELLEKGSGVSKRWAEAKCDIKSLLKEKKMTITALKKASGLSQRTISQGVNGHTIQKNSAEAIATVLGQPPQELFRFFDNRSGLDPATIARYHSMLGGVLQTAVNWDIIADNPARKAHPPKDVSKEARYLTKGETVRFLNALEQEPIKWRTFFTLLLFSGFRRGEAAALEWKDVDFEANTITVRHSLSSVTGQGPITKDPKTSRSQRRIAMPRSTMELLAEYKRWQNSQRLRLGAMWADKITVTNELGQAKEQKNDRVFTGEAGEQFVPASATRWLKNFRTRHDLPPFTPHSLRHTNVSMMLSAGTPIPVVSGRVGHSNASTTLDIYAHMLETGDQLAAQSIENTIFPERKKQA